MYQYAFSPNQHNVTQIRQVCVCVCTVLAGKTNRWVWNATRYTHNRHGCGQLYTYLYKSVKYSNCHWVLWVRSKQSHQFSHHLLHKHVSDSDFFFFFHRKFFSVAKVPIFCRRRWFFWISLIFRVENIWWPKQKWSFYWIWNYFNFSSLL